MTTHFYDNVENGKAESELTKKIDEAVVKGRKNEMWRSQYMKERVLLQDAKEEGKEEAIVGIIDLNKWLTNEGRSNDFQNALEDPAYMEELLEEYKNINAKQEGR